MKMHLRVVSSVKGMLTKPPCNWVNILMDINSNFHRVKKFQILMKIVLVLSLDIEKTVIYGMKILDTSSSPPFMFTVQQSEFKIEENSSDCCC